MIVPWAEIVDRYDEAPKSTSMMAMRAIARQIAEGPLSQGLFGWTSMFDLCIAQTPMEFPPDGPYLRISPDQSRQEITFTYVDSGDSSKHWTRRVPPSEADARFIRFLDQLRWFPSDTLRKAAEDFAR